MEKFNVWADDYTGVQPFLPLPSKKGTGIWKFVNWIKWIVVGLLKFPFVWLSLLLLVLLDALGQLVPLPALRRLFLRTVHTVFGGLLLFLLGFFYVDAKYVPSKRGNKMPSAACGSGFKSGHVIVANHSSYVEIIYLLYKFSPQFTIAPNSWTGDKPPEGKVIPASFYRVLLDTIYQPLYTVDQAKPLESVILNSETQQRGPVVLFPESTTTNGKVLLGCVPVLPSLYTLQSNLKGKIHLVSFKYEYTEFSAVYTAGSFVTHLFWLSSVQLYNVLQVRYVIDADIPPPESDDASQWPEKLYDLLASAHARRRAKIMATEKQPFLKYYYQYEKGYKHE